MSVASVTGEAGGDSGGDTREGRVRRSGVAGERRRGRRNSSPTCASSPPRGLPPRPPFALSGDRLVHFPREANPRDSARDFGDAERFWDDRRSRCSDEFGKSPGDSRDFRVSRDFPYHPWANLGEQCFADESRQEFYDNESSQQVISEDSCRVFPQHPWENLGGNSSEDDGDHGFLTMENRGDRKKSLCVEDSDSEFLGLNGISERNHNIQNSRKDELETRRGRDQENWEHAKHSSSDLNMHNIRFTEFSPAPEWDRGWMSDSKLQHKNKGEMIELEDKFSMSLGRGDALRSHPELVGSHKAGSFIFQDDLQEFRRQNVSSSVCSRISEWKQFADAPENGPQKQNQKNYAQAHQKNKEESTHGTKKREVKSQRPVAVKKSQRLANQGDSNANAQEQASKLKAQRNEFTEMEHPLEAKGQGLGVEDGGQAGKSFRIKRPRLLA